MSVNNELNSYMFNCFKAYEKSHPECNLLPVRKITTPYEPCGYCDTRKPKRLINRAWVQVSLTKNALSLDCCGATVGCEIQFCPMCGRKMT